MRKALMVIGMTALMVGALVAWRASEVAADLWGDPRDRRWR